MLKGYYYAYTDSRRLRSLDKFRPIDLFQILSLDVVLGACVGAVFIAKFTASPISFASLVALALSVWLIYTADHLLDAYRLKKRQAHTARHRYHQIRFRALATAWAIVATIGIITLFFLPSRILYYGLSLTLGVTLYFIANHYISLTRWLPKELMSALLYTVGVFLPSFATYGQPLYWSLGMLFVQYFFLALSNLLLFSWFELETDQQDDHTSFARLVGRSLTRRIVLLCLSTVIVSSVLMLVFITDSLVSAAPQLTILLMGLVLLAIMIRPVYFTPHERYRLLGDGIFLLPLIPLLLL